jgi:4-hydroxybenzoate polyprenyltransferase
MVSLNFLLNHPYSKLLRLHQPVGILLLLFPCWWGVLAYHERGALPLTTLALFALGAVVMRSAGCIINDLSDKDIDGQVARTRARPLASGAVSVKEAYIILLALLCAALLIAMSLGEHVVWLGMAWLPLIALYPRMKRWTWWPQAFLGLTFGAGPLFGMVAMTGNIYLTGILLYAATIFWVIGYDTIYACQDREDDARIGIKSTARLFGDRVEKMVAGCYIATIIFLLAAFANTHPPSVHAMPFMCGCWLLLRQIKRFNPNNPTRCHQLFTQNVWVGAVLCLAFF